MRQPEQHQDKNPPEEDAPCREPFLFIPKDHDGEADAEEQRENAVKFPVNECQFGQAQNAVGRPGGKGFPLGLGHKGPAGKSEQVVDQNAEEGKTSQYVEDIATIIGRKACSNFGHASWLNQPK